MSQFYDFGLYIPQIVMYLKRYPNCLVYGEEGVGKTTYITHSIERCGYLYGDKPAVDMFGRKVFSIKRVDAAPSRLDKQTIYESVKPFDGLPSIRISRPTHEQKVVYLNTMGGNVSIDIAKIILKQRLLPAEIIDYAVLNYIPKVDKDDDLGEKDELPYAPDTRVKLMIENVILRFGKIDKLIAIKMLSALRYNRNFKPIFDKYFDRRVLTFVSRMDRKIPTRKI